MQYRQPKFIDFCNSKNINHPYNKNAHSKESLNNINNKPLFYNGLYNNSSFLNVKTTTTNGIPKGSEPQ
jgi:hypothetical protein